MYKYLYNFTFYNYFQFYLRGLVVNLYIEFQISGSYGNRKLATSWFNYHGCTSLYLIVKIEGDLILMNSPEM